MNEAASSASSTEAQDPLRADAPTPEPQRSEAWSARDGRIRLFIVLLSQALLFLLASGRCRVADEYALYFQAESLFTEGRIDVPQALRYGVFFGKTGRDGRPYAPYGPASALFALPHHALARSLCALRGLDPASSPGAELCILITSLATSTALALTLGIFFTALRELGASRRRALLGLVAIGPGSVLWSYGLCFYAEAFTTLLLTLSLYALIDSQKRPQAILAGLSFGLAVACKAPLIIALPPYLLWAWSQQKHRRARSLFFLLFFAGLACAMHLGWNFYRFQAPMDFGYDWSETIAGKPQPFSNSLVTGLYGLLLSPGKGLLFYAPVLALSLFTIKKSWQDWSLRALAPISLALISLVFYGSYVFWEGGYCVGPRHLVPFLPMLALPGICLIPWPEQRALRRLLVAALILALLFQFLLAQVSFLEDQAISGPGSSSAYYDWDESLQGRPKNVYKLDYNPLKTYPPRLLANLREWTSSEAQPGRGLDHWWIFWSRVARASGRDERLNVAIAILAGLALAAFSAQRLGAELQATERPLELSSAR